MKTSDMAKISVIGALVTIATMLFQIPSPATKGYINLGDTFIFVGSILLGGKSGFLLGGIGSALADILSGYAHWAPFTLVIKGLEGYIAGFAQPFYNRERANYSFIIIIFMISAFIMVAGYFVTEIIMYGIAAAFAELGGNLFQGGASIVLALLIIIGLKKVGVKI